jgi:thymidylate synthase ThyX
LSDEQRRVFSVIGTLPEPGGYAIAKFSRSAKPYAEWIQELTQEGASRFYDQFYFSYGHASIADLAHVTMVAENISIVAAIEVLDEQLVDAQESSTRYQDYTRRRFYTPQEIVASPLAARYAEVCELLFATYREVHRTVLEHYERRYAAERPPEVSDDEYRRTMRARAFDVARYLLPSSTYTGLGYLCSARTLERQIRRLAGHPLAEIREIAEALRCAAVEPAHNPRALELEPHLQSFATSNSDESSQALADKVRAAVFAGAASAPTLVRHTRPSPYPAHVESRVTALAGQMLPGTVANGGRGVELAEVTDPTTELAATLLYRTSPLSYAQILAELRNRPSAEIGEVAAVAFAERGPHDELLREARVGYQLVFDVCIDNGAFRDLHRHRNCIQIMKDFTAAYGYDVPPDVDEVGKGADYRATMDAAAELADRLDEQGRTLGQYVLPLAFRRRALFKMDAAELTYIAELRTRPTGHFSYREAAYQMYAEFARRCPELARHIQVTDPTVERFFER